MTAPVPAPSSAPARATPDAPPARSGGSSALASLRSKLAAAAIVVFWVAMMGSLLRNYLPGALGRNDIPPLDTTALADSWVDTEEWMELRWNHLDVGVMRTNARRLEATVLPATDGTESRPAATSNRYHIAVLIAVAVGPFQARVVNSALLDEYLFLEQFEAALTLGDPGSPAAVELNIAGRVRGSQLLTSVQRDGLRHIHVHRLRRPVSLAEALAPLYARADLKPGDSYSLPVFDPVWNMKDASMIVRVEAREPLLVGDRRVETLRIRTEMGPTVATTWVDDTGAVVKRSLPPLEMSALEFDEAVRRHPWMQAIPPPPDVDPETLRGPARDAATAPNRPAGLLGLLQTAISPSNDDPRAEP